jgi:predicted ATPase/DNA-binding XRE family transcriptional regulator
MPETKTFGAWIRQRRRELDLTQEELARRVGCARITVRKIEAGELRPSKQMAELLREQLEVPSSEGDAFLHVARGESSGVLPQTTASRQNPPGQPPISALEVQRPASNIPAPLTRLIGRERELRDVARLLAGARLLTLTGSGGVGKTRLALQVAAEVLATFKDGVWFVELAPLSDEALVPSTIASILGVREERTRPLMATLLDSLRNKEVLLILDNCEHLLDACARLADDVLHASRDSRVLATSREALGITGESSYRVPSLECPSPERANQLTSEQLEHFPAVQLFTERATQAVWTFTVTNANAAVISQICDRLDGIPLAIELAAARVRSFSLEEIAARLDDRLSLLTGGGRTALPRQQTLRATLDWSHALLSETERLLFRRLSAFTGGWTLEEAEQICAGNGIQSSEVSGVLTHLVGKSLVTLGDHAGGSRYRMLETIRQFARERLLEANESELLRDQHLHFFVKLAEDSQPVFETARRVEWLPRLEIEHDNLRAALEWACQRDLETACWLAGILERFWFFADHLSEARTWYDRVLDPGEQPTDLKRGLGLALFSSGCVLLNLGYLDEAGVRLEQSVAAWQQLGEPRWLAFSVAWLAYLLVQRGDPEGACTIYAKYEPLLRASNEGLLVAWVLGNWGSSRTALRRDDPAGRALLDEALSLARILEDPFCYLLCYSSLGDWAVLQGDYAAALQYYLDSLEWRRQLGTRWIIASGLWQVANTMRLQADYLRAEPVYAEALALSRALADQRSEAHISQELAAVALHLGDLQRAATLLERSLSAFRRWGDALGAARCLLGFADLQLVQGHAEKAARVLSFIEPWLQSNKIQLVHFDRSNHARSLEAARKQLSEATFATARAAGIEMTPEEVIASVLAPT